MPHKIIYSGRFPIRQKREDGTWGCRGCGEPIPSGRHTWCSRECVVKFHPGQVLIEVRKRDKDICSACGFDCRIARQEWIAKANGTWPRPQRPPRAEYDHVIPFSEGGLTVLENIRTLCRVCHTKRTAHWRRSKNLKPQATKVCPESGHVNPINGQK